jgi:hypothetical protein
VSEPLALRKVIQRIRDGAIRIPGFQRKFVWEPDRAALLMDSIFKGYPFGSVLLWRTRTELKTEKSVGGFQLPPPEKDYPIDYVLDGQQRLTSVFATFQTELAAHEDPETWLPIYYDFESVDDAQNSRFIALQSKDADPARHFPLACFFDPVRFMNAVQSLSPARSIEIATVQERFKEAMIPAETFETEDRASVAIVFERVNRMGVELDMFELLTAWTWSEDFDLQAQFNELSEEFESFGFREVGSDNDLMLRCCSAILKQDPSPAAMIDISGTEVRDRFESVANSLRLAIDFLRLNLNVRHLKFLPYSAQLIPLAAYFSINQSSHVPDAHRKVLLRWFWRCSFSHRYSGNPGRNIQADIIEAVKLRSGEDSTLDRLPSSIGIEFFYRNTFSPRTVATKTVILMLAASQPKSFLSGQVIPLDEVLSEPNRKEFHHCMPRAYLKKTEPNVKESEVNALGNIAIISRAENRKIGDKAPSQYRAMMPDDISDIAESALLPNSLWKDNYGDFLTERCVIMAQHAAGLMESEGGRRIAIDPDALLILGDLAVRTGRNDNWQIVMAKGSEAEKESDSE